MKCLALHLANGRIVEVTKTAWSILPEEVSVAQALRYNYIRINEDEQRKYENWRGFQDDWSFSKPYLSIDLATRNTFLQAGDSSEI